MKRYTIEFFPSKPLLDFNFNAITYSPPVDVLTRMRPYHPKAII